MIASKMQVTGYVERYCKLTKTRPIRCYAFCLNKAAGLPQERKGNQVVDDQVNVLLDGRESFIIVEKNIHLRARESEYKIAN